MLQNEQINRGKAERALHKSLRICTEWDLPLTPPQA